MALTYAIDTAAGETPETIAKKREVANLLAARLFSRAPQNVGEGINAIGQALIARSMSGDADAAQKAGLAGGSALGASLFGGAAPSPAPIASGVATPAGNTTIPAGKDEFVNSVMPLAQAASEKTGLDPRLIVAQAALESGYGQHAPGNNLFGIKSHGQPGGNVLPTTEVVNGQPVQTSDSFRAYASPADSVSGYADFMNQNPRYAPVKAAPGLEGQAAALGQSGYATDPQYGSKVLQIAKMLPAPSGGVLADNTPSPLDTAQYPAGPVGAPAGVAQAVNPAPADDGSAELPANAAPAQGALPTAQAVQAASQPTPQANPRLLQLQQAMGDPRFAFLPKGQQAAAMAEYKGLVEQQQQANDPLRQLQIKKAQQDLADGKIPIGFQKTDNGLEPIPGGPADLAYLRAKAIKEKDPNAINVLGRGGELYKVGPDGNPVIVHKNEAETAMFDDPTISAMASQYLAGDKSVMTNLGRGAQGVANIVKLRTEIYKQAQGAGLSGRDIVDNFNEQAGALAGQRAVGTRAANISLAANEANNMIPIALEASDKLPRSQYMPWNSMVQAVQKGSSSPELASFVAATNSLVNSYVRAVSPSGVPTDSMREHAYSMLNQAQGPEAYKSVIRTMQLEMKAALEAPSQVKKELRHKPDTSPRQGTTSSGLTWSVE